MTFLTFLRTRDPTLYRAPAAWTTCALLFYAMAIAQTSPLWITLNILAGTLCFNQLITEAQDLYKSYKEERDANQL